MIPSENSMIPDLICKTQKYKTFSLFRMLSLKEKQLTILLKKLNKNSIMPFPTG
eukprot:UN01535